MSKKVLILGDSYARLDPKEGHWANKWCKEKGYEAFNSGMGGANHVSIINEIFVKDEKFKLFQEWDLIIYCMTNWLRAGASESTKTSAFFNRIEKFNEDSEKITFENLLSTNIEEGIEQYAILSGISEVHHTHADYLGEVTTQLYKSISIPFLARANLFAVETLIFKCKDTNTPLILATTPSDSTSLENLNKYNTNIFVVKHKDPPEGDLKDAGASSNHLDNNMHTDIQEKFNTEYGDII